jgi:hypothetical protein
MKKTFRKNLGPKMMSLILGTAIWMMVQQYLEENGMWEVDQPLRAQPAPKDEQIRDLETRIEELMNQVADFEQKRIQLQQERDAQEIEDSPAPTETP